MEGISVIIPVFNKLEITLRCIGHIRDTNRRGDVEIIVVDNGSTDGTPEVLARRADITVMRNEDNLGIAKACNGAAGRARHEIFCFMHNDVFVHESEWGSRLGAFFRTTPDAGVVGLYGAKTLRRDGSFRGRTIVHAKKDGPTMERPFEKVAVVDGLLLGMRRDVFRKTGGFNEDFQLHYYDKDISMRALSLGLTNYILRIPFEHAAATTRGGIREDSRIREDARRRFMNIWGAHLPADVSTWREKITWLFPVSRKRKHD